MGTYVRGNIRSHVQRGLRAGIEVYEQLTQRQKRIVTAIREARARGFVPSYRELADLAGTSTTSVHRELERLEGVGVLRRGQRNQRRVIELAEEEPTVAIPVIGRIAAGVPILAEEHIEARFSLPRSLVGHGDLFMLRVAGESMIGAGLHDGDYVVVRRQSSAESGDIVAAMLTTDGESTATVKYLSLAEGGRVRLLPANPNYAPIEADDGMILGPVMTIIRRVKAG